MRQYMLHKILEIFITLLYCIPSKLFTILKLSFPSTRTLVIRVQYSYNRNSKTYYR